MTIEEKAEKTFAELGVQDEVGVQELFGEARAFLERFLFEVTLRLVPLIPNEGAAAAEAKRAHDRILSRKSGFSTRIRENWLKAAASSLKSSAGREFNTLKDEFFGRFDVQELLTRATADRGALEEIRGIASALTGPTSTDLTLPGFRRELGSIHPVIRVQREIEEIFLGLGFRIETGPEIESVYYNFDALNIPESHPSRDDWDTLYVDSRTVLRTHTSPVQIRAMLKHGAPLYIITPGKCYRNDNPDATHSPMFHQCEGLAVDTDITFADLKGTLDFFAKKFFGEKTRTRFQPSFFPFTEPSGEVAASCPFCEGKGCKVCKESGWIELMGCGMVHPEVLRQGGIDPTRYSGWAFGLGIDRFAMLKYDIGEIQHFFQSDVRFLKQF